MSKDVPHVTDDHTQARANLAGLCGEASENLRIVLIQRRKGGNVALIITDELEGLWESVHLPRSPKNVERFLAALERVLQG